MGNRPFNPKSTTFTNLMLDYIMPDLSPNAWKIICLAMRKTEGWEDKSTYSGRKESDIISVSQFMGGCGIGSDHTVKQAIKECVNRGYLLQTESGNSFRYHLNVDYELPIGAETAIGIGAETAHTNTKVNNKEIHAQNILQNQGDPMNKDEYLKQIEKSIAIGMVSSTSEYAHYPERIQPVVERMVSLWHLKAPERTKRGGQYAYWIESCEEVMDSCAEFGVGLLDNLHEDWYNYMLSNRGVAPHTVSSPDSLVKTVRAKAALMRGGSSASLWKTNGKQTQSRLDV